jgi:hypothetical protein
MRPTEGSSREVGSFRFLPADEGLGLGVGLPLRKDVGGYLLVFYEQLRKFRRHLAQTFHIIALIYKVFVAYEFKLSFQGEAYHEEESEELEVEYPEEVEVPTVLSYYRTSELAGALAVARYEVRDDHDQILMIGEDIFYDTPEDFVRLETDVIEAVYSGVDTCVASNLDPELLPQIWDIIKDAIEDEEEE